MSIITKTPIQLLRIATTPIAPPTGSVLLYCGSSGALKILDSTGNANAIATVADVTPKLDAEKHYDSGVNSSFFHTPDGGGYELLDPYDDSTEFIKFKAIENDPVKICIGAIDFMTESGTRLIHTLEKIYYTKDSDSDEFATNDELATIANIPTKLSQLTNDNNFVVDANYIHTDSNYTSAEKAKLAGLDSNHFKGSYATLSALEAAHPTAEDGDYAYVGTAGTDAIMYIWDNTDSKWVQSGTPTAETPASVKEKYEGNEDTNAYHDADKAKIGTIGNVANLEITAKANLVAAINEVVNNLSDYVPETRKINSKALSSNIAITNSDIGSEPAITAGTTSQYWRGDKTWATFPSPTPSAGTIVDFWPANGFGRFSTYVLRPRFSSTGGICGPDGWMIFSENGNENYKNYFATSGGGAEFRPKNHRKTAVESVKT